MSSWNKWLFGGLGWALGGPVGGIIGFALGAITENSSVVVSSQNTSARITQPGDFGAALLILCAVVMKADSKLLKSELDFIKAFFTQQFGTEYTRERMLLLREILNQDINHHEVCEQIKSHLNYASRLELLHLLFGLALADGTIDKLEEAIIEDIANGLGIKHPDYISLKAMFVKDKTASYKILEIETTATDDEVKKAYRKMALKFHPDKVHHLGIDFQKDANEKFKKISVAYEEIKKERGM